MSKPTQKDAEFMKMNSQRGLVSTFVIALLMAGLVIVVGLSVSTCYATEPEDLPWSNETDVIILPVPPLPPIFSDFSITPTEIELGDYIIISFVIENTNNQSITYLSTNRIGDITQIIEIELENYESKIIWYRIIPHIAREYDVWIDGHTGTFKVTSIIPEPEPLELNLRIDRIDAELVSLQDNIGQVFNMLDGVMIEILDGGRVLHSARAHLPVRVQNQEKMMATRTRAIVIKWGPSSIRASVLQWSK